MNTSENQDRTYLDGLIQKNQIPGIQYVVKVLFFSPQKDNQGREIETTLGWHRGRVADTFYYGKPGGGPGFRSNLRIYPDRGIATAWLMNETGINEKPCIDLSDILDRPFLP
jgi:hypothetical protein